MKVLKKLFVILFVFAFATGCGSNESSSTSSSSIVVNESSEVNVESSITGPNGN